MKEDVQARLKSLQVLLSNHVYKAVELVRLFLVLEELDYLAVLQVSLFWGLVRVESAEE